jgi:hypothetical protein
MGVVVSVLAARDGERGRGAQLDARDRRSGAVGCHANQGAGSGQAGARGVLQDVEAASIAAKGDVDDGGESVEEDLGGLAGYDPIDARNPGKKRRARQLPHVP